MTGQQALDDIARLEDLGGLLDAVRAFALQSPTVFFYIFQLSLLLEWIVISNMAFSSNVYNYLRIY